jgi:hypothetical protein
MSLGETQLPWASGVLDGRQRRSSRPTVVSRNLNHIGISLGNATCNSSDTDRRHELHRNPCFFVDSVKIVDKLGKILQREKTRIRRSEGD